MSLSVFSIPSVSRIDRKNDFFNEDYFLHDEVFGRIRIKKYFITDYASIDALHNITLFPLFAMVAGYGQWSAPFHDWLYRGYGIEREDGTFYHPTKEECDMIFYRALRNEGIAQWRARVFLRGLQFGGKSSYHHEWRPFIPEDQPLWEKVRFPTSDAPTQLSPLPTVDDVKQSPTGSVPEMPVSSEAAEIIAEETAPAQVKETPPIFLPSDVTQPSDIKYGRRADD